MQNSPSIATVWVNLSEKRFQFLESLQIIRRKNRCFLALYCTTKTSMVSYLKTTALSIEPWWLLNWFVDGHLLIAQKRRCCLAIHTSNGTVIQKLSWRVTRYALQDVPCFLYVKVMPLCANKSTNTITISGSVPMGRTTRDIQSFRPFQKIVHRQTDGCL